MNRSFIRFLIIAVVCCTLVVAFGRAREDSSMSNQSPQVGRFILESGEYVGPSVSAMRNLPGVFKIDTTTGRVWRYAPNTEGREIIENWVLISE